ncbi:MAG: SurA N-terminal domain-containing protein, partial [Halobacteriovoraceae bacterium]|nr:SurA N-terminal domain-containing protein [Halobacteriovoraceae bacterium]
MSQSGRKGISNFLVTFLIGLIVVSFMFTGYESTRGTPDTIAKVGNESIKIREYQIEFGRRLEFYKRISGGKDLTSAQIKRFRIKDNTLSDLVDRKLMINLADDLKIMPASDEVRENVKKVDYFQTNGQFDLLKYKNILSYNRWTPKDFENSTENQLKRDYLSSIFKDPPISQNYLQDVVRFKEIRLTADTVRIVKGPLRKHIKVSKKEIRSYLKAPANLAKAQHLFKQRKPSLDRPAEFKVSHILLNIPKGKAKKTKEKVSEIRKKLNSKNFGKMAARYNEDPISKKKKGDLGWMSKGKMPKEFEKVAFKMKKGSISSP